MRSSAALFGARAFSWAKPKKNGAILKSAMQRLSPQMNFPPVRNLEPGGAGMKNKHQMMKIKSCQTSENNEKHENAIIRTH